MSSQTFSEPPSREFIATDEALITETQRQEVQAVTQHVVQQCVDVLGRCTFSSEQVMYQCLDSAIADLIDDVVWTAWKQHHCFQSTSLPLVVPDAVKHTDVAPGETTTASDCSSETTIQPTTQPVEGGALRSLGVALVTPVQWTVNGIWGWTSWAAHGLAKQGWVPWRLTSLTTSTTENDVNATAQASNNTQEEGSLSTLTQWFRSERHGTSNNNKQHRPKGVIFLPALHGLCHLVLDDIHAHHPYLSLRTFAMLEDYVLQLSVRNVDVVTEYLLAVGRFVPLDDARTGIRGVFCPPVSGDSVVTSRADRGVVQKLFSWIALLEFAVTTINAWENQLDDLTQSQASGAFDDSTSLRDAAAAKAVALREAIDGFKLIQIQMFKVHSELLESEVETSLEACLTSWELMMEHFPEVFELADVDAKLKQPLPLAPLSSSVKTPEGTS